jgi:hypothetical protein
MEWLLLTLCDQLLQRAQRHTCFERWLSAFGLLTGERNGADPIPPSLRYELEQSECATGERLFLPMLNAVTAGRGTTGEQRTHEHWTRHFEMRV